MKTNKPTPTDHDTMVDPLVLEALLLEVEPVEPPADRAMALRDRVLAIARPPLTTAVTPPPLVTLRADEGEWIPIAPGVDMKILHDTPQSRSVLYRLAPGGALPAHRHRSEEECIVLSGDASLGDHHVREGDFHLAPGGTHHGVVRSVSGVVLFVRHAREARVQVPAAMPRG